MIENNNNINNKTVFLLFLGEQVVKKNFEKIQAKAGSRVHFRKGGRHSQFPKFPQIFKSKTHSTAKAV